MKKVIWKYKLECGRNTVLEMPLRANILCTNVQGTDICLWVLCDKDNPMEERRFDVLCTGEETEGYDNDTDYGYINTVFMHTFVFHVFEKFSIQPDKL